MPALAAESAALDSSVPVVSAVTDVPTTVGGEIDQLEQQKAAAAESEQFEEAARLKKQIEQLKEAGKIDQSELQKAAAAEAEQFEEAARIKKQIEQVKAAAGGVPAQPPVAPLPTTEQPQIMMAASIIAPSASIQQPLLGPELSLSGTTGHFFWAWEETHGIQKIWRPLQALFCVLLLCGTVANVFAMGILYRSIDDTLGQAQAPPPIAHDVSTCLACANRGDWWSEQTIPIEFWGCRFTSDSATVSATAMIGSLTVSMKSAVGLVFVYFFLLLRLGCDNCTRSRTMCKSTALRIAIGVCFLICLLTLAFVTVIAGVGAARKYRKSDLWELCPDGSPRANVPAPTAHDKAVCCNVGNVGNWWSGQTISIEFWGCQCEENDAFVSPVTIEWLHYPIFAGNLVLALLCVPNMVRG